MVSLGKGKSLPVVNPPCLARNKLQTNFPILDDNLILFHRER